MVAGIYSKARRTLMRLTHLLYLLYTQLSRALALALTLADCVHAHPLRAEYIDFSMAAWGPPLIPTMVFEQPCVPRVPCRKYLFHSCHFRNEFQLSVIQYELFKWTESTKWRWADNIIKLRIPKTCLTSQWGGMSFTNVAIFPPQANCLDIPILPHI